MKRYSLLFLPSLLVGAFLFTSCATTHPNSKLLIGKWKPVSVEKYVDPNDVPDVTNTNDNAPTTAATIQPAKTRAADSSRSGGNSNVQPGQRQSAALDRLIRMEERAEFEVFANGAAVKYYYPNPIKAKWKMKAKGTKVVVKGVANDRKFVIEIFEITDNSCTMIERTEVGDLKVKYTKL